MIGIISLVVLTLGATFAYFQVAVSDTSVTNLTVMGLENRDTSNVTNMANMFYNFGKNATYTLDLSGWNVSNISSSYHYSFNDGIQTKVIAPTWNTN